MLFNPFTSRRGLLNQDERECSSDANHIGNVSQVEMSLDLNYTRGEKFWISSKPRTSMMQNRLSFHVVWFRGSETIGETELFSCFERF
jgi:hypothetical protein